MAALCAFAGRSCPVSRAGLGREGGELSQSHSSLACSPGLLQKVRVLYLMSPRVWDGQLPTEQGSVIST